ncbi:MAG: Holliday junction resolvase RuvX [Solirubrobacterales bacterium]
MRILALDYGAARIGCAISDRSGTLATPIPSVTSGDPRRSPPWPTIVGPSGS